MDTNKHQPVPNDVDSHEGDSVAARHAAAAREKGDPTFGHKSVSLWAFLICAFVLLFGGNYMGKLSGSFSFDQYVIPGYVPEDAPGKTAAVAKKDWIDEYMALGKKRFSTCAACHSPDGSGNPANNYPPLAGSEWVTGNTEKFAMIVLSGLAGPISVKGKTYVNNMPSQAAGLKAEDLGAVMTYVRRSFGHDASVVTPEMAKVALDLYAKRQADGKAAVSSDELLKDHDKMLPGSEVDPKTGQPMGAGAPAAPATDAK